MLTCPSAGARALRVRRSAHENRSVRPLGPRKDQRRRRGAALAGLVLCEPHLDVLLTHKLHTGASMLSAAPVTPEEGSRANNERVEQHTHLARFASGFAIPLTLLAQRTGAATVDAGRIHHAQASIAFLAPSVGTKRLRSRDSAASHPAGGQSRDQRSVLVSRVRPHLAVHILVRERGCRQSPLAPADKQEQTPWCAVDQDEADVPVPAAGSTPID